MAAPHTLLLPRSAPRITISPAAVLALLIVLVSSFPLYSQVYDYTWRPFSEGIFSATTTCFGFANNGDVVAGTTTGLYRLPQGERQWQKSSVTAAVFEIVTTQSGTLIAGTDGGTFRSTDNGLTWQMAFTVPGQIHFLPRPDGTIFAAQGGEFGPPSYYYKSTNDGEKWSTMWIMEDTGGNNWMAVTPKGDLLLSMKSDLLRSTDNGKTWESTGFHETVYRMLAASDDLLLAATGTGVWKSTDEGVSWALIDTLKFHDVQIAPNGDYFYMRKDITALDFKARGIYRATDQGNSRTQIVSGTHITGLGVAPDGTIWIGSDSRVLRSRDNGNSWEQFDSGMTSAKIISMTRAPNDDLFALARTGSLPSWRSTYALYRSNDNGETWRILRDSLDETLLVPGPDGSLFAAQSVLTWKQGTAGREADSTTVALLRSPDGGTTWERVEGNGSVQEVAMNGTGTVAAAFTHRNLAQQNVGGDIAYSRDGGESWRRLTEGAWTTGSKSATAVAVLRDNSILFGAYTTEGGLYRITPDDRLEEINKEMVMAGIAQAPDGSILAVAAMLADTEPRQYKDPGIYRSTDNGTAWTRIKAFDLFPKAAFRFGENGVAVMMLQDAPSWISTDNGQTWRQMQSGSPSAVLFHESGSIFMLDDRKPSYTVDKGVSLFSLEKGLPVPWLTVLGGMDLPLNGLMTMVITADNDLLGGTWGYGIYRLEPTSGVEDEERQLSTESLQCREVRSKEYSIRFRTNSPGPVSIALFDILGRKITSLLDNRSYEPGDHRVPADLSTLPTGTYVIAMSGPDGNISAKVQVR